MTNKTPDLSADDSESPSGDTLSEAEKEALAREIFPHESDHVIRGMYKKVLSGAATREEKEQVKKIAEEAGKPLAEWLLKIN